MSLQLESGPRGGSALAFSPDSQLESGPRSGSALAFLPDSGQYFFDECILVFQEPNKMSLQLESGPRGGSALAFSTDEILVLQVPKKMSLQLESGPRGGSALAFSPDGRRLAVGIAGQATARIKIYDFPSGALVAELPEQYGLVYELTFHQVHIP
jgi:WD40 repeat protein